MLEKAPYEISQQCYSNYDVVRQLHALQLEKIELLNSHIKTLESFIKYLEDEDKIGRPVPQEPEDKWDDATRDILDSVPRVTEE